MSSLVATSAAGRALSGADGPGGATAPGPQRAASPAGVRRTVYLIIAGALMGLGDLACTIIYMRHIGMIEINPIARQMAEIGGDRQIIMFKLLTMLVSGGALYMIRRHRSAELWSWVCSVMLLGLTAHWVNYNRVIPSMTFEVTILAMSDDSTMRGWVSLSEE